MVAWRQPVAYIAVEHVYVHGAQPRNDFQEIVKDSLI